MDRNELTPKAMKKAVSDIVMKEMYMAADIEEAIEKIDGGRFRDVMRRDIGTSLL